MSLDGSQKYKVAVEKPKQYIYLIRYNDSKYREEGVSAAYHSEAEAEKEVDRLNLEDEDGYSYYSSQMEIK